MKLFISILILTAILLYFIHKNYNTVENYLNFSNFTKSSLDTIYNDEKLQDNSPNNFQRLPPYGTDLDKPVIIEKPKSQIIDMLPEIKEAKKIQAELQKCPEGFYECVDAGAKYCSPFKPINGNKCNGEKLCRVNLTKNKSNIDINPCTLQPKMDYKETGSKLPIIKDPNQVCVNISNLISRGKLAIQDANKKFLTFDYNDGISNVYVDSTNVFDTIGKLLKDYFTANIDNKPINKFYGIKERPVMWHIEFSETKDISCDVLIFAESNKSKFYLDIKNDKIIISPFRGGTTQRFSVEPIEGTGSFFIKSSFNNKYISYTNRGGIKSNHGLVFLSEDKNKNSTWKFYDQKNLVDVIGSNSKKSIDTNKNKEKFTQRNNSSQYYSVLGSFWTPQDSKMYNGLYQTPNYDLIINLNEEGNGTVQVKNKKILSNDIFKVKQIGNTITSIDNNPNRHILIELITGPKLFTFKNMPQIKVTVKDNLGYRSLCGKEPLNLEAICYKTDGLQIKTINEDKTLLNRKTEYGISNLL